jgi:hypothetical protein
MGKRNSKKRAYTNLLNKYKRQGLSDAKAKDKADHATNRRKGYVRPVPPQVAKVLSKDDIISLGAKEVQNDPGD